MDGVTSETDADDDKPSLQLTAFDGCPGETEFFAPAPSAVQDDETLVRFIKPDDILEEEDGSTRIQPGAFSRDDIKGTRDKDGRRKSISTFRFELTELDSLVNRARAYSELLEVDPRVAKVSALSIRKITEPSGRRELCIYAEPVDEKDDPNGPCDTHAGIRRTENASPKHQRVAILMLRSEIADCFNKNKMRLISGECW